ESEARLREAVASGQLDAQTEQQEISSLEQGRTTLPNSALQSIIDDTFLAQAAAPFGITVSDADVDAQLQQDASQLEQRRATVLTFKPAVDVVTGLPTDAQKAAALANGQKALADLQAGKDINAVAQAD